MGTHSPGRAFTRGSIYAAREIVRRQMSNPALHSQRIFIQSCPKCACSPLADQLILWRSEPSPEATEFASIQMTLSVGCLMAGSEPLAGCGIQRSPSVARL